MEVKDETWDTHLWFSNPRHLAIEPHPQYCSTIACDAVGTSSEIHQQTSVTLSLSLQ
jgi:hypothetical protein